jgi:hypothetical protein
VYKVLTNCDCARIVCSVSSVQEHSYISRHSGDPDVITMQKDAITTQQDANPSARPEQPPDSTFCINRVGIRVPLF